MTTAKQNQKFPFHFFFRFAVEGWGEETREKCKEIFWFLHTRVRERVRGALVRFTMQSERTRQFQATTRSARAISIHHQDFGQSTFELCLIHTAKIGNRDQSPISNFGGGGEIRTLETLSSLPPFQGGALDHYATPPYGLCYNRKICFMPVCSVVQQYALVQAGALQTSSLPTLRRP